MVFNNKVYDILKWIAQIALPATGTLYFALAGIWGFPYGEQIVGTITAIDTFIGVLLGISSSGYSGDGTLNVTEGTDKDVYSLDLEIPVEELSKKNVITFKVKNKQ